MLKILFFLHKIGPYHHARFTRLAEDFELTVVEILPASKEYEWQEVVEEKKYKTIQIWEHLNSDELKGKRLLKRVESIILDIQPNLIIVTGWFNRTYLAALLIAKDRNLPIACISDSRFEDSKRYWITEKIKSFIIRLFDAYLVAGTKSRKYIEFLGVQHGIFMPWDVVDNEYFATESVEIQNTVLPKPYILCVSRFIKEKNLETLIHAFIQFKEDQPANNTNLLVIGSGQLKQKIEDLVVSSGLRSVFILPFIQYNDLPLYYKNAEALILPSIKDTWGLVVNEAMASGLPVFVSEKCGCANDLVREGENGFIFQPDKLSIIDVLLKFSKFNSQELQLMGKRSQVIIKSFSLHQFSDAIKDLYKYIIENGNKKISVLQKTLIYLKLYV